MKIEIVIFENKMWNEIPNQDNPAFDYKFGDNKNPRKQECILVCKVLPYRQNCVGKDGFTVIYIPLEGDVIVRGLFWNIEDARIFAEAIANH